MAATDKISGEDGTLTVAGGDTFLLTEWALNETGAVQDVTDSGSAGVIERIPNGYLDWGFTAKGFLVDGTATPTVGAAAAECVLTAKSGTTYTGNAIITSKAIALAVNTEESTTVDIIGIGAGALLEANA